MLLQFLSENNGERAVRNKSKVETISIVTSGPHHILKGIAEAYELGTTIGLMQMGRALAIPSPTLLRDYDLTVKSFLPPACLLFLHLGIAVGWSNGPFDDRKSVRSSVSPGPKVTAPSCGASCKSSECDSNDF